MPDYKLNINGESHTINVEETTPMLWVLRDHLQFVGTKFGCGIAQCGACTIHIEGVAVRSCQLPVSAVGEQKITTIEGLSEKGDHPVQKAWIEHDVPQLEIRICSSIDMSFQVIVGPCLESTGIKSGHTDSNHPQLPYTTKRAIFKILQEQCKRWSFSGLRPVTLIFYRIMNSVSIVNHSFILTSKSHSTNFSLPISFHAKIPAIN